jgi:hypothetical protein
MLGSTTAPGRPGARDDAPVHVAFHSMHSVGVPGVLFSRLNTQPMRTPVNASPSPSRGPTHDSGTVCGSLHLHWKRLALYSLPVSRRMHCQLKPSWYPLRVGGERLGIWKRKACPLSCPEIGGQGGRRQARLVMRQSLGDNLLLIRKAPAPPALNRDDLRPLHRPRSSPSATSRNKPSPPSASKAPSPSAYGAV